MVKKREKKLLSKIFYIFISVLAIILVFYVLDYKIHHLNEKEWGVPSYYYRNKIIYGTIWGLVAFFILRKWQKPLWIKTLIFSSIIAIALQVRYFIEGYPLNFVILFLFLHLLMLWPSSYVIFRLMKKKI